MILRIVNIVVESLQSLPAKKSEDKCLGEIKICASVFYLVLLSVNSINVSLNLRKCY